MVAFGNGICLKKVGLLSMVALDVDSDLTSLFLFSKQLGKAWLETLPEEFASTT